MGWCDQEHWCDASPIRNEIAHWLSVRREASGPRSHSLGPREYFECLKSQLASGNEGASCVASDPLRVLWMLSKHTAPAPHLNPRTLKLSK